MKPIFIASLLLTLFPVSFGALWNLEKICECELGYNALAYNNYGCWCGLGGSQKPIDGVDRCCMMHDKCYDRAVDKKLCITTSFEYIDDFRWQCTNNTAACEASTNACAAALCACDKAVVDCWKQYEKPRSKPKCNGIRRLLQLVDSALEHFEH
ncbi:unnamed protein product, partial [Mesorhabditis belari]|uniref:Phospholipase A2 n=1 Tax=Mesorhabditis belari TaxID=2138241 RepID=A0AAF3F5K8_9BILA